MHEHVSVKYLKDARLCLNMKGSDMGSDFGGWQLAAHRTMMGAAAGRKEAAVSMAPAAPFYISAIRELQSQFQSCWAGIFACSGQNIYLLQYLEKILLNAERAASQQPLSCHCP
jgi:hypothetical protein